MTGNPIIKIAAIVLAVGLLAGGYFVLAGGDTELNCKTGCEQPVTQAAPLVCNAPTDCELRGKDEWESCEHISAPRQPEQEGRPARDQTSKSQEGYSCGCVEQKCAYFKP